MQNQTFTEFQKIPVDLIQVSDLNFRKDYDEETLDELKKSLDECGELQPIVVRKKENGKYELIIGSRRLLATKKLGSEEINAIITEGFDDKTIIEMALTENLQRENLTPFEEASAIVRLINDYGMKLKDVAKKIGKSNGFVRNRMQLLSLPEDIQKKISEKKLPISAGKLATIKSSKVRKEIVKTTVNNSLSEDEMSTLIGDKSGNKKHTRNYNNLTGTKISLKIRVFAKFLDSVMPTILGMQKAEIILMKETLRKTGDKIANHVEELDRQINELNR